MGKPKIFLGCDLSTAEDRITKVRTKSPRLIERARLHPTEHDEHKMTATQIFHIPVEEIDYQKRYLAKRGRHSFNYGVGGQRLSDELLKEGFVLPSEECDLIIEAIANLDPEIREGYQRGIRRELMASDTRSLRNAWGFGVSFKWNRMDDDLYRRAYAWKPQGECAQIMNMWGLKPAHALFRDHPSWGRINQNGHDSLLMSVLPTRVFDMATFLTATLEQPVDYDGVELTIPVEFSMGTSWKCEKEFKVLPSRAEMTEMAVGLWEKLYNQQWS